MVSRIWRYDYLRRGVTTISLVLAFTALIAEAMYLPGMRPNVFEEGDVMDMQVNVLTSLHTHLPFSYYKTLPVCKPSIQEKKRGGNIGGVLLGDRIEASPFTDIRVLRDVRCKIVCLESPVDSKAAAFLSKAVKHDYHQNFILDGLPLAQINEQLRTYTVGAPVGFTFQGGQALNNHLHFTIRYAEVNEDIGTTPHVKGTSQTPPKYNIVAFVAKPMSIQYGHDPNKECHNSTVLRDLTEKAPLTLPTFNVTWSYSVEWELTIDTWMSRWDVYVNAHNHNIHWYSIVNSTLMVLFLSAIVAVILMRTLRKDFVKYNSLDPSVEDLQDETGWKLLHRDVFRTPPLPWLLAALTGSGVQLFVMTTVVLLFALLGFFSPQNRGSLFTTFLVYFALLGSAAGFSAARLLKLWGHTEWKYILATGTVVPGVSFGVFFVLNSLVWSQSSSAAVPIGAMAVIIAMWLFVTVPLVFLGAIGGFKRRTISLPVCTSQIPRHIPTQPWYGRAPFAVIAGVLPFGAVLIEVYFILSALWLNRYYQIFGFLSLVLVVLTALTAEVTIVLTYFSLCAEEYRWWWRSFITGSSVGLFLYLYSVFYMVMGGVQLHSFVPVVLYLGYMALLSFLFSITTGTVGFLSSFLFVRFIYSSIKLD